MKMIHIPEQLKKPQFKFVKLGEWDKWKKGNETIEFNPEQYDQLHKEKDWKPLGKAPFEKSWQKNGYSFEDPKLLTHKGNYGVIGGYGNLRILDCDNKDFAEEMSKKLDTFTIETGSGGKHIYFISDYEKNHVLIDGKGELRANNYQVVGANSTHPNGNKYKVVNDKDIITLTKEEVEDLIKPCLREEQKKEKPLTEYKGKDESRSGLEYRKVLALLHKGKSDEEINTEMMAYSKWKEGTEQYRQHTLRKAKEYLNNPQSDVVEIANTWEGFRDIGFFSNNDIENMEILETKWLVENLFPVESINVISGTAMAGKSWLALHLAYCISEGKKFLNKYNVEKGNVLYIDRENGQNRILERCRLLKNGSTPSDEQKEDCLFFSCKHPFKLDYVNGRNLLINFIKMKNIKLVIVDTFRRVFSGKENQADDINPFYNDLKQIVETLGCSFILLHHNRKGTTQGNQNDSLRGSSDIVNFVDSVLQLEKFGNIITMKQTKSRDSVLSENKLIDIESNDNSFKFIYVGVQQSRAKKTARIIADWTINEKIEQFTYSEGLKYCKSKGSSVASYKEALRHLQSVNYLEKGQGRLDPYIVVKEFYQDEL